MRTTCGYCGVGCQLYLHVKDNRVVKVSGVEEVGPNIGSLCVKGRFGYEFIHHPERLTTPLIRENGRFREAGWEEALDRVAAGIGRIRNESGADAIGVLTSAPDHQRGELPGPEIRRARCSEPTTSTTAPGSDTPPRWPVWPQPSAAAR